MYSKQNRWKDQIKTFIITSNLFSGVVISSALVKVIQNDNFYLNCEGWNEISGLISSCYL